MLTYLQRMTFSEINKTFIKQNVARAMILKETMRGRQLTLVLLPSRWLTGECDQL